MSIENKAFVIIPVFNEEENIVEVILNTQKVFNNILCIDDGSTDSTLSKIKKLKSVQFVSHSMNCGQGTSILTGIKYFLNKTDLEYLITLDGDGQHSISDAKKMLNYIEKENLDALFGSRFLSRESLKKIPLKRIILLKIAIIFERIFYKIKLSDAHNGLRVLRRSACEKLKNLECSEMAHSTEIAFRIQKDPKLKIGEFISNINYKENAKGSQFSLNSLNIISELIQRK